MMTFPAKSEIIAAMQSHPYQCHAFVPVGSEAIAGQIAKLIDPCKDGDKTFHRGIPCYAPDAVFNYDGLIPTTNSPIVGRVVSPALTQLGYDRVSEMLGGPTSKLTALGATAGQIALAKANLEMTLGTRAQMQPLAEWVRSIGYVIAEPQA